MLNNVDDRTPPCETPVLDWRCVDVVCDEFGMFVWCSLCVSVCMLTVSNALLISSATAIVCSFL